jgi:hypothetical protein
MKLRDLFDQIETLEFSLNLSVLSGFKSVLNTLEHDEIVQQLVGELQRSNESPPKVFAHLLDVLSKYDQPDYVQFSDEAITVYLYVLNRVATNLAQQSTEHILQKQGLWWARRLAKHILETPVANPK